MDAKLQGGGVVTTYLKSRISDLKEDRERIKRHVVENDLGDPLDHPGVRNLNARISEVVFLFTESVRGNITGENVGD